MIRKFLNSIKYINKNNEILNKLDSKDQNDIKSIKVNIGQIQADLNTAKPSNLNISDYEFQVFSQFGDDGIIQYLISQISIPNKIFIEFGVENYRESNTRFLLINNKWSGLIIDGGKDNIDFVKRDFVYSMFDLHAREAFITVDNINGIIQSFVDLGYSSEIGLLSIDIDGNDYWIWKAINVINPIVVIIEYNSLFGPKNPWTIPYDEKFYRLASDSYYQYWGASISALCHLSETKGYDFIGCNSHGNNAYFVRKDKIGELKKLSPSEGYKKALFREYFRGNGEVLTFDERINLIKGKPIYNVYSENLEKI
jgi:hypothetical protein